MSLIHLPRPLIIDERPINFSGLEYAPSSVISADEFIVRYPFVRETVSAHWLASVDGAPPEVVVWRPGIVAEQICPDDFEMVAHGEGEMRLTMISAHKPGRYPERVFYERRFTDPDGKTFGRSRLLIATREKFNRLCRGYAVAYRLTPQEQVS